MAIGPGFQIGSYEVLSLLGRGGMGEVWRARDMNLDREVAIKVLPEIIADDPDRRARFEREAMVLASLNHPNIATLYGLETIVPEPGTLSEASIPGETEISSPSESIYSSRDGNTMVDTDNSKTGVGQIKWSGDTITLAVNGMIGGDVYPALLGIGRPGLPGNGNPGTPGIGRDADYVGIVDFVATWDPSDELSMWLNFDAIFTHGDGLPNNNVYAVAVAGRLAVTESTGFSLRGEYIRGEDVFKGSTIVAGEEAAMGLPTFAGATHIDLFSITGTFDHRLAEHLKVRFEGRYDIAYLKGAPNRFFVADKDPGTVRSLFRRDDQVLALVEMLYEF